MDVLFITGIDFTSVDTPQLGQLILKNILIEEYDVDYVNFDYLNMNDNIKYSDDMNGNLENFTKYILKINPKILGFYTIANSFPISVEIAKRIKILNKEIIILFGGPHATVVAEECLKTYGFLDAVCLGESELTIRPLIKALLDKDSLGDLKGAAYRENDKVIINKCAPLVPSVQLSDYTVYDYYPFNLKESQKVTIEGGRGCPFSCSFCSTNRFWENTFRIKPIESLIDEMKCFYDKYGIKCFDINHDLFTANREYIISFCSCLIQKNLNFNWYCSSRVDVLDFDLIDLMKKAGCKGIFFGIESGSANIQKNIRKNLNLDSAEQILVYCHNNGLKVVASFIYGLPEETISDFDDTINFIERLINADIEQIQLHKFIPFPGTDEYLKVKDRLYFDLLKCDFSIMYNKNVFTDEILLDVKEHVDLYPQFYVFNSEVNDRFTTIGEFMDYLTLMSPFKICLKIVIKKYGLLNFYLQIKYQFDQMYDDFRKSNILNRVHDEEFIYKQFEFTYNILEILKLEINSEIYDINLAYGVEMVNFIKSNEKRRIRKFTFNIEKMIKEKELIKKDCFVLFKKNEKEIIIKQFQNIGSVLNEYRKED